MKRNIIVFGASGGVGTQVVMQALDKGFTVTAIVREPSAFKLEHPNLTIEKGDVMQPGSFLAAMRGKEAVISAIGSGNIKPTTVYSQGIRNIIAAMRIRAVPRISAISAGGLYLNDTMGPVRRFLVKNILQRILREPYTDLRIMENELRATELQYTIVRPPRLTNKPLRGEYRSAINSHLQNPSNIARADVAHFLVNQLSNSQTFKTIVEIAY
jgi:putative NADH-flavin reductase